MARIALYIDGFNLYHSLEKMNKPHLKWVNHWTLGKSLLSPGDTLERVVFFTAVLTWERAKQERHKVYIEALKAVGCVVVESRFARIRKYCRVMKQYCARHEEKQTDVGIATAILRDGVNDLYDTAVLVTADSDQIPTVEAFKAMFPDKRIILAAPPGHSTEARELGKLVHDRKPLTEGRLRGCLLPHAVKDGSGKIRAIRPTSYLPPA